MKQEDIKHRRLKIGISQSKLSEIVRISKYDISSFELGKKLISKQELDKIGKVFDDIEHGRISFSTKKKICKESYEDSILAHRPRRSYTRTARNQEYLDSLNQLSDEFHKTRSDAPKAISFFAGCGGLCYGLQSAGFEIVASNELIPQYAQIHRDNFPASVELSNDIKDISDDEITRIIEHYGPIDLFAGGPPCQGFSLAGKRDVKDNRNTLFQYYLHLASICRPKVILMENVKLLTSMKNPQGGLVKDDIISTFNSIGYNSAFFVVNARDYGVPQDRFRVIFIGIEKSIQKQPSIPAPDFGCSLELFGHLKEPFTFGDAVSDLEYLESGESSIKDRLHRATKHPEHVIRWLIDVPEGKSAHDNIEKDLVPPSGFNTTYKRQVWNEPARTITTNFNMISGSNNVHPIATRALTIREAMRIQSFPDTFMMNGSDGDVRTVIGNAVPPILAYKIGLYLLEHFIASKS